MLATPEDGSSRARTPTYGGLKVKAPRILEVTLRDGSYAIDFQFTAADTATIAGALECAGIDLIEVGHGIGLGASEKGMGAAAGSDDEYMKAAAEALTTAEWGMFCIPGIARLEHIDRAAGYGMQFLRVGTNVTEIEQSLPYIERAKKHGMYVFANFMKSYAMTPSAFAQRAKLSQSYGADVVCVVDSAGGMLTSEMEQYICATKDACDVSIGFHGHDNLHLAAANSLRAVELGVEVIDTSLQGMGRSAGNTATEVFVMLLARSGVDMPIDALAVLDVSERYIRPMIDRRGNDSIDIVSGYAQFHSSFMGVIREMATRHRADPRRLIIALCDKDKVNAPRDLVEELAVGLAGTAEDVSTARFNLARYHGAEQPLVG